MILPQNFYRVLAIASVASALTTLMLIFLPEWMAPAPDFTARMARVNDPYYILRSWVYLLHPFLVMAAALGAALRLRQLAAPWVIPGFLAFLLWGFTEAGQQTLTIAAFDRWRRAWLAGDETLRSTMQVQTAIYDGMWDAMYLLILIGFLIANVFYAAATVRRRGLTRVIGWLYLGAALLTTSLISGELGGPVLPDDVEFWLYPALQPLARASIGVWLWQQADETRAVP